MSSNSKMENNGPSAGEFAGQTLSASLANLPGLSGTERALLSCVEKMITELSILRTELEQKSRMNFELIQANDSLHMDLEYTRSELAKKEAELAQILRSVHGASGSKSPADGIAVKEETPKRRIKPELREEEEEQQPTYSYEPSTPAQNYREAPINPVKKRRITEEHSIEQTPSVSNHSADGENRHLREMAIQQSVPSYHPGPAPTEKNFRAFIEAMNKSTRKKPATGKIKQRKKKMQATGPAPLVPGISLSKCYKVVNNHKIKGTPLYHQALTQVEQKIANNAGYLTSKKQKKMANRMVMEEMAKMDWDGFWSEYK